MAKQERRQQGLEYGMRIGSIDSPALGNLITHERPHDNILYIMNRLLLVVRSMADKSIELSRGVGEATDYGDCKASSDIDVVRGMCGCLDGRGLLPTFFRAMR
jgi:hypothetical protein